MPTGFRQWDLHAPRETQRKGLLHCWSPSKPKIALHTSFSSYATPSAVGAHAHTSALLSKTKKSSIFLLHISLKRDVLQYQPWSPVCWRPHRWSVLEDWSARCSPKQPWLPGWGSPSRYCFCKQKARASAAVKWSPGPTVAVRPSINFSAVGGGGSCTNSSNAGLSKTGTTLRRGQSPEVSSVSIENNEILPNKVYKQLLKPKKTNEHILDRHCHVQVPWYCASWFRLKILKS